MTTTTPATRTRILPRPDPRWANYAYQAQRLDYTPPASELSADLNSLLLERQQLRGQLDTAAAELAQLRIHAERDDRLAAEQDAAAAVAAVRSGTDASATPAGDALRLRRTGTEQNVGALRDAITQVEQETYDAIGAWRDSGKIDERLRVARAQLSKTGAAFKEALAAAVATAATAEWADGMTYDGSDGVDTAALAHGIAAHLGDQIHHLPPASALLAVDALINIAGTD